MSEIYGYIKKHIVRNPVTGKIESETFSWEGGEFTSINVVVMEDHFSHRPKDGEIISIGPYRLYVIGISGLMNQEYECIRITGFWSWVRIIVYRMTRVFDLAYRRFIITLAVWRLANYHDGRIPTWRDINILRRVRL